MLALLRGWSSLPSGSSDLSEHPSQGEHLIWRCSQWISRQEVAVGSVLVRVQIFLRVDGKRSMRFQHWKMSNSFAENRSDEHSNIRNRCA